jgi:hypothetical protein
MGIVVEGPIRTLQVLAGDGAVQMLRKLLDIPPKGWGRRVHTLVRGSSPFWGHKALEELTSQLILDGRAREIRQSPRPSLGHTRANDEDVVPEQLWDARYRP